MPTLKLFLILLAFTLLPNWSNAHPHVWVYTSVEILLSNKQITGVKVHWNFDELYSASFLQDADANQNLKLEENELRYTLNSVFKDNLEALYSFMHIKMDQQKSKFKLLNPKIWMGDDETLNYVFELELEEPVSLDGLHEIAFYDPEFYISFEQDLDLKWSQETECAYKLRENRKIIIYDGLVHPETYQLNCSGA